MLGIVKDGREDTLYSPGKRQTKTASRDQILYTVYIYIHRDAAAASVTKTLACFLHCVCVTEAGGGLSCTCKRCILRDSRYTDE